MSMKRRAVLAILVCAAATLVAGAQSNPFSPDPTILIPESLEAEGSFGLFLNSFDYAANEPAEFALLTGDESTRYLGKPSSKEDGNPRVLYTNLANFGEIDSFQLGGFTKAGPGNFGGALGWGKWSSKDSDNFGNSTTDKEDVKQLNLAYGWRLSKTQSLGFSYLYADDTYKYNEFDGGDPYETGKNSAKAHLLQAQYRQEFGSDKAFTIGAWYSMKDSDYLDTFPGYDDVSRDDLSGKGYGLRGRLNWWLAPKTDLQFTASYGKEDWEYDNRVVEQSGSFRQLALTDDIGGTSYMVGAQVLHRLADTDFAAGVELGKVDFDFNVNWRLEDEGTYDYISRQTNEYSYWALPLAVRHHFSPKFSVFAGARFMQYTNDYRSGSDYFETFQQYTSKDEYSATDYRFGARYQATDGLSVQILAGEDDSSDSYPDRVIGHTPATPSMSSSSSRERIDTKLIALQVSLSF